ncbi:hypothetical protein TIFTF001_004700 [Ficus carica]|uniref:Peptidase A1 domain-containing protein n=1 Tax=Ficus carica TaxID=3494 RepID=A0AA87ZK47_FICCA|nr:hypothetical protein TIFTF001_004700 [Ficus carica]
MSPGQLVSTAFPIFLLLLLLRLARASSSAAATPLLLRPPHANSHSRPAFLLPLYQASPDSSKTTPSSSSDFRRHLQRFGAEIRPNARMSLFDDLLLNGYYTTRLWIGTPPQQFSLIVDTGSSVTYVPCSTCDQCGKHQDPRFDPELSSSYQPVKCNIDCTCDNDQEQCIYERQYAEMSTSSGVLGEDLLTFGNQSELAPQRAVFGCENMESGDLYTQHADGIMGLGRGDLSVVDQLVDKGVISDSFSLCYGGMDIGGGAMVLGGISHPSSMVFAHSDAARSPYYNVDLKEIHVAGKKLPLNPMVFDGKHGTVLDSGTTYAYLPEPAFVAFKDAHSKVHGGYCLGIFQNGKDPTTLLGGIIVRNSLVMYDREHSKIGFWKTNCSELWETLHISDAPPPISPAFNENVTTEVPPTLAPAPAPAPAPDEAPDYVLPEDRQIGQIRFELSFNISHDDLKPHITELAGYIASELNVDVSQVRLLNFTSNGNNSFVAWAIVPAASTDFISDTTATSIIAQLAEHGMQLRGTFSNYKLVRWNAVPKEKRNWWHQGYLVAVLAIFVTLVISLSAVGAWFILRRRRESLNAYKPVDAVVPEQELQPL